MLALARFVEAQQGIYERALAELRGGTKSSHWIWFIFPQLAGLGSSPTAKFYAITDRREAEAYLSYAPLESRLAESTRAMLEWAGRRSAEDILGQVDAMKFKSSMTLFEAAGGGELYARALDTFYGGERDAKTLELLGEARTPPDSRSADRSDGPPHRLPPRASP
jgi:uncharacterized protein (DUF1810 family)